MISRTHRSMSAQWRAAAHAACALATAFTLRGAVAQTPPDPQPEPFANPSHFVYRDGGQLYRAICQGCHMADAKGASGAGAYPGLAENPRLAAAAYPVVVLMHGKNGMPPFKGYLDDAQIAAVVNYVRTHFGNHHADSLSPEDVKKLR
jgi:mono/diheme cytochrome c family protein